MFSQYSPPLDVGIRLKLNPPEECLINASLLVAAKFSFKHNEKTTHHDLSSSVRDFMLCFFLLLFF